MVWMVMSPEMAYLDWNNSLHLMKKAYDSSLFVLIIGPKGTGKTSLVRKFCSNFGRNYSLLILAYVRVSLIWSVQKH
jgi:AAA+ ATPase superfamily predicted ATPase